MQNQFDLVVACDLNRGIGVNNQLPWRLRDDMKNFSSLTTGRNSNVGSQNAVIMGRKTWQSIPAKFRPLPDRFNIVVTSNINLDLPPGVVSCKSLDDALKVATAHNCGQTFVIGGARIYEEAMEHPSCRRLYITEVFGKFECDVFFPLYKERFSLVEEQPPREENGIKYAFKVYEKAH
ncbi:MAG TPA: dihydrofolate reductase [Planktothrix sp.]